MEKYALISVSDKENIIPFAEKLVSLGYKIISTGGTYKLLKKHISEEFLIEVKNITNFPEILDGRVKTLHPKIFGGILADRRKDSHLKTLKDFNIPNIEIVVVNLYPFEKVVSQGASLEEAIENIDIGGVSLLRAAAKNFENVLIVCDKEDYNEVLNRLENNSIDFNFRLKLAVKAFKRTRDYDNAIFNYLEKILNSNWFLN